MILVPLLTWFKNLKENEIFPASICIIFPICFVSLWVTAARTGLDWITALPYLLGSGIGGILAGIWGQRIPVKWLHRILGILILWGGVRYLC